MAAPRGIGREIIQLREAGMTYEQIADRMQCSKNTINYHCKKVGLTDIGYKKVRISPEIEQEIYDFCNKHGVLQATKRFDMTPSTIYKIIKRKNRQTDGSES